MKRVVSGLQPSGDIHLGNYLGAMQRWAAEAERQENFYFIANLHALTTKATIKDLRANTLSTVAWLLAVGLNPEKSIIFAQSEVSAHAELSWILNNFVTMGELTRMTQYKDKSQRLGPEGQLVGLFDYPVLQAADVLLYDADAVPVGKDQKQHVELMRDIAARFNNAYGKIFKLPEPAIQELGATIMNLQDPVKKMSKSDPDQTGVVSLSEDDDSIRAKFKKAVTDSGSEIRAASDKSAISNLLQIYSLLSGQAMSDLEELYRGKGYGDFKADLAEKVVEKVAPLRERHAELVADERQLLDILEAGRVKAEVVANAKLAEVKAKLGLL